MEPITLALGAVAGLLVVILVAVNLSIRAKHQRKIQSLISVIDASQQLGATTSMEKLMSMVTEMMRNIISGLETVVIYVLDEEKIDEPMLRVKGVDSPHQEAFVDFNPEVTSSWIYQVMKERKARVFGDFNAEAGDEKVIPTDRDFHGAMVAPMMFEGRAIGAIFAACHKPNAFNEDTLHLFALLTNQVALAVRNVQLQMGLQNLVIIDSLSGMYNHGYFQEHLGKTITKAKYSNQPVSLMILDMDFFKKVNDNYGHPQGDALLKQLGAVIKGVVGPNHTVCRYGGDEFTVTMPETNRIQAVVLAEKIRQAVEEWEFVIGSNIVHITISGGVASFPEDAETKKELIEKADQAMYEAKHKGRNKICFAA
ncbi:MAG TPA: sensor domain-containing diguanylate cyclase [Candidatus Nitrosotenuis sp.]|jgi:diguanylate cyclase (GGDEF)-like protein|nr:sensor domain-containing diguanylate cyclase [Candidatus Nitrosotenuis sp.]